MSPLVQSVIAGLLVVAAGCYLAWRGWRSYARAVRARRAAGGDRLCGPGCGCGE